MNSARLRRRRLVLLAKLTVGGALLGLAAATVDWNQFVTVVKTVLPAWLVVVALMGLIDRLWMAGKWLYLLKGLGLPEATFWQAVWHYFQGGLVGTATQWQLGGDIARALALGQQLGKRQLVVASLVFEKIAGACANGLLATIALALLIFTVDVGPLAPALMLGAGVAGAAVFLPPLLFWGIVSTRRLPFLSSLPGRIRERLRFVSTALTSVGEIRRVAIVFFLLTLGEQIVPLVNILALREAFGLQLTVLEMFMVIPVTTFVSRLPISIESLGVREGLYVALFSLFGVSPAEAFAMALAVRVIDFVVVATGSMSGFAIRRYVGQDMLDEHHPPGALEIPRTTDSVG